MNRARWLLLPAAAVALGAYLLSSAGGRKSNLTGAAPSVSSPLVVPDEQKLVGQWMRTDSDYMIWIGGVSPDGKLSARYLNPRPINVSRAAWKLEEGRLRLLVELQDRNYPGSYYELTHDPVSDGLSGVYHHRGQKQDFDVAFYRFDADEKKGEAAR